MVAAWLWSNMPSSILEAKLRRFVTNNWRESVWIIQWTNRSLSVYFQQFGPSPHAALALLPVLSGALPSAAAALGFPVSVPAAAVGRGLAPPLPLQLGSPDPVQPTARVWGLQALHCWVSGSRHPPVSCSRPARRPSSSHPTGGLPVALWAPGAPPPPQSRGAG